MTPTSLAAWIVNYQALAAAVLLVALVAGLLVRQPARRAALDWATLAGLLALAGLSALPGWPRLVIFAAPAASEQPEAQPPAPIVPAADAPRFSPREFTPRFEPTAPQVVPRQAAAPRPQVAASPVAPPKPKAVPWRWSELAKPLVYAYLAGMLAVAAWLLWGGFESWRLVRRGTAPADDLLAELATLTPGKPPRLLVSRDVSAAAALGALRPTILVTPQLAAAPAEVVRAVLAHELAHLRHGDLWFLALGRAGLLLLYPQPCYWWLRRRAADSREALADAAAAGPADRTQYAELLVAAARTLSDAPRRGPALAILERPSQLGRRVKLLLDPRGAIELRSSRRWRWLGAAAAAAVVLAASLVQVMPVAVGQGKSQNPPSLRTHLLDYVILEPSEGGTDLERAAAAVGRARFRGEDAASPPTGKPRTWPKTVRPPRMIAVPGEGYPPGGFSAYRKNESPRLSERTPGILFGDVTDEEQRPLAGVRVRYWTPQQESEVITDSAGRYTFDGVDEGEPLKYVQFTQEGFSPQLSLAPQRGGRIDATLTDRFYFTGKVRDLEGLGVAGAQVRASFTPTINGLDLDPIHVETATDAEGNYKLLVGPESYDVTVTKAGSQFNLQATTRANGRSTKQLDFQLAAAEPAVPADDGTGGTKAEATKPASRVYRPVEPDATGALTYRAQIVDHDTGMPVEKATVVVKRLNPLTGGLTTAPKSETTTDDFGEFSFTLSPAEVAEPRLYLIFDVQHPGYVEQQFSGGELNLTRARERVGLPPEFRQLELNPGDSIFGQVVTPAGQPVAGLEVRYLTMASESQDTGDGTRSDEKTVTDAEGRFRFNAVRGGLTRLWLEPADYAPRTLLLGKRTGDLGRIELQEGKQLTGTLLDVEGRPVPNAWVKVGPKTYPFVERMSGEQGQRVAQTDAAGRFVLAPLLPGKYQASVSGREWINHELRLPESPLPAVFLAQLVTVGKDAPTNDVTLRATPHVRVEATLVDRQGAPVGDAAFNAFLHGKVGDAMVGLETYRDRPGHISILAPRGLHEARLDLGLNRAGTVSYRRGPAGQLIADRTVNLETLDQDVDDIQVVHIPSPTLTVQPIDSDGRSVDYARPRIDYPRGTRNVPSDQQWPSGVAGQVMLSLQADGRWRSEGLLPDQDFTLTLELPSGQTVSRAFKLQAGEAKEATIVVPEMLPYLTVTEFSHKKESEPADEGGFRILWDEGPMEEKPQEEDKKPSDAPVPAPDQSSVEERIYEPRLVFLPLPQLTEEEKASAKQDKRGWVYQGSTPIPFDHEPGRPPRSIARPEEPQPYSVKTYEATSVPTKINGRVTDDYGQPLPGVKVDAWHWREGNETTTDAGGHYELSGFEPHEALEIVFSKDGLSPLLRTDIKAGTVFDVTLDDKTSIAGSIRDAAGQPVEGATVRASCAGTIRDWPILPFDLETKTDAEGRYRLLASRGNFDLWVRKAGVGLAQRAFAMALPGAPETIDLQLEKGVGFEARLRDSVTGKPVAGVKLASQFADVTATSDANGLVALDALPQVQIVFEVKAPGYARWWSRQTSIPSDHHNPERAGQWHDGTGHLRFELSSSRLSAEIELEPAVTVRGRVVDPNGAPVEGATLAAVLTGEQGGASNMPCTSAADGRFELHLPASGAVEYNLIAHDGPWRKSRNWANAYGEPIRTTPGQTIDGIELRLTRGATIRGQVVDDQGQPVAGKGILARPNHARAGRHYQPRATTDAEGRFELKNVEAGSNTIMLDEHRLPEDGPPGSWRQIEVKPGGNQQDIRLVAEPDKAAMDGPLFTTQFFRLETEEEATQKAAETFRPDAVPHWDGAPRLIWDEKPIKKD